MQRVREAARDFGVQAVQLGAHDGALTMAASRAYLRLLVWREPTGPVLADLHSALAAVPLDSIEPAGRPYYSLALAFAAAGSAVEARRMAELFASEVAARRAAGNELPAALDGMLLLFEDRPLEAIEQLRAARSVSRCARCLIPEIGYAFDRAGMADSAASYYAREADAPVDSPPAMLWRPLVLERLGQLHDERGDAERARGYYARFADLWAEADAPLQPRVAAARERVRFLLDR
jgi:hypothetical protein